MDTWHSIRQETIYDQNSLNFLVLKPDDSLYQW